MTIKLYKYTGLRACLLLLLFSLISFANGCSRKSDTSTDRAAGQATEKVTICQGGVLSILPLIAQEQGLFAAQGLTAEIIAKGDGKLAFDALLAGECTFATVGEPPLVANIFTRTDYVVLASLNITNNATKIIARRDLGIQGIRDLKGKPVGARKGTISHYFLDLALIKNGMRPQDVTMKFMEPLQLPEALVKGEIIAYSGSYEQLLKGRTLLGDKAAVFSEPGLSLNSVNLVARKDFVSSHSVTIQKLLKALLQAEEFNEKKPDEARKIVQRLKIIPAAALEEIFKEESHRVTLPQSLLLTLEGNAQWMIDSKMVASAAVPNFLNIIDPAPLKALKPSSVSINK